MLSACSCLDEIGINEAATVRSVCRAVSWISDRRLSRLRRKVLVEQQRRRARELGREVARDGGVHGGRALRAAALRHVGVSARKCSARLVRFLREGRRIVLSRLEAARSPVEARSSRPPPAPCPPFLWRLLSDLGLHERLDTRDRRPGRRVSRSLRGWGVPQAWASRRLGDCLRP